MAQEVNDQLLRCVLRTGGQVPCYYNTCPLAMPWGARISYRHVESSIADKLRKNNGSSSTNTSTIIIGPLSELGHGTK
jgi:hypothetical protein